MDSFPTVQEVAPDKNDQEKLQALRAAIEDGIAGGVYDGDAFNDVRSELGLPLRDPLKL